MGIAEGAEPMTAQAVCEAVLGPCPLNTGSS